jgi:N-acetylmuramoyl-L-alanine amidase
VPATTSSAPVRTVPAGTGPVIVVDPGHSPTINAIDPATGLNVSDYANEPEMRDVFSVAEIVRARLSALGYRVVMTKTSATQRVTLAQRAEIADNVHAALALSIHDQAGSSGGIAFDRGNNIVYYQSVGTYRSTAAGKRYYFTNARLAATSKRYGQIFRDDRQKIEGHAVTLLNNTGYNLGSRGLAGGDIWMVQLLSHVPWIYNEAGGNSAGRSGLDSADQHAYADALVASVERCVPV